MESIGDRIKKSRKDKNITQQELADKLNIDRSTLSRYENDKIDLSVRDCEIIAGAIGISPSYLLGRETEKDIYETVPNIYPVEGICTFKEIGTVRAGYGGYAIEEPTGRKIIIPIEMLRGHSPEDFFVLRVNGNSMYPKLINGDNILGLSYQMAAKKMREIKRKNDRLKLQGKLYIQDYFDYFDKEISR